MRVKEKKSVHKAKIYVKRKIIYFADVKKNCAFYLRIRKLSLIFAEAKTPFCIECRRVTDNAHNFYLMGFFYALMFTCHFSN